MKKITFTISYLLFFCMTAYSQADKDGPSNVMKSLNERITREMPGWTHQAIEPIDGSKNVVIELWERGDIAVKIAITEYDDSAASSQALREFKRNLQVEEDATKSRGRKGFRLIKENLSTLGEDGLTWDIRGSEALIFRKGEFVVSISVVRPEPNTDSYFSQTFGRQVAEVLR